MTVRSRLGLAGALVLALAESACEPSGPGTLTATVHVPAPTGAVVIEFAGPAITAFEGVGGARTFADPVTAADTLQRVVVVSPTGTTLQFRVSVEDVRADAPRGVVVDAVDLANRKVTALAGYSVRVSR